VITTYIVRSASLVKNPRLKKSRFDNNLCNCMRSKERWFKVNKNKEIKIAPPLQLWCVYQAL